MVKLLMTWDIKPGREEEYFEFVMQEFIPGLLQLGMQPTEAWYTLYGRAPQILAGWIAEDRVTLDKALSSREWHSLRRRMLAYVDNLTHKIVPATSLFQL